MNDGLTGPGIGRGRFWRKLALYAVMLLVVLSILAYGYWRYTFPYGYTHACSKGLGLALRMYASDHDEWLPYGKPTREASLSLLYQFDTNSALWVLSGKHIPRKNVEHILSTNGLLGPDTCGWHYIEGLRATDSPMLVVAWDKVTGLWHNGQRRPGIMHEVVFLDGSAQFISKSSWPSFLAQQKQLLAEVRASRASNAPPILWSDEESLGPNVKNK